MRCKHLPQDNANVSITYAKKNSKVSVWKIESERERETVGISKTKQRNVKPHLLLFGLFTLPDCLASPDWNLPPRRIAIYQKTKAFCKSSSSWPLCMFDSADVSPPRVPTKEPRLSANLRRPGQFACLTLRNRLQSCPQKASVLLKHAKWSAKLCILKLQSAFMLVGHWAVMGRARPRQVAFIKGFGFVALHIYWNWLVARPKGDQRRGEEKRGEGRKYRSGTISDLWKSLESKNRYAHSLRKKYPCQNQRGREREIDNLYWQDSAGERLYIIPTMLQRGDPCKCNLRLG